MPFRNAVYWSGSHSNNHNPTFFLIHFQLVENHDCLFDDAVAPELALDFDCQNVSTGEGFLSWGLAIGAYLTLFNVIKYIGRPDIENPAVGRDELDDICIDLPHHEPSYGQ